MSGQQNNLFLSSSLLYEHVSGHGQHHRRSHRLGLPQTDADGPNSVHPRHARHQGHNGEGMQSKQHNREQISPSYLFTTYT